MRRGVLIAALCCLCAMVLARSAAVSADVFGPIQLTSTRQVQAASGTLSEQAENASESTISADGRYVAFVGSFGGVRGLWRRSLETGAVEQVAPGEALLPSISAEGRYVSFTTSARLNRASDRNGAPDVYVRDMNEPCQSEAGSCEACVENPGEAEQGGCPFTLVSAVEGTEKGATYQYVKPAEEEARYGSLASGRSAMSADGSHVVFETAVESNLLGVPTPAREILVRDLQTQETALVSSEYDPQTGTDTGVPVPMSEGTGAAFAVPDFGHSEFGGASISADGSTVAWLGQDIRRQARLLAGEQATYLPQYDEPLWRRIDAGPTAPTRRVTGGSDPEAPLCAASGESQLSSPTLLDPCQGPFAVQGLAEFSLLDATDGNFVPQLSADGDTVAFLASAREVAAGEEVANSEADDDLYVSQMTGGLTRVQALRRLSEIAGVVSQPELAAYIVDLAISADGSQVAFTTQRTEFPLTSLSDVSTTAPRAGIKELFDVDLADETLTRVTHGYTGETAPSEIAGEGAEVDGAASPSFDESGNTLSFTSNADNLVYGDGNGAADAFLLNRVVFANFTATQYVSSPPSAPSVSPAWRLYATAMPRPDGSVVLEVSVPGSGQLGARAGANLRVRVRAGHSHRTRMALLSRTVASARAAIPASTDGLQKLTLTLASPYRRLARRPGLSATIALRFAAAAHATLHANLHVRFQRIPSRRPARRVGSGTSATR